MPPSPESAIAVPPALKSRTCSTEPDGIAITRIVPSSWPVIARKLVSAIEVIAESLEPRVATLSSARP